MSTPVEQIHILLSLIKSGADVDAVDDHGVCVTEHAYTYGQDFTFTNLAGRLGDLWDHVLVRCGYDLFARRTAFPRRPSYSDSDSEKYSRKEFEEIWAGWESYCPYYDDPPEWPPKWSFQLKSSQNEALYTGGTINSDKSQIARSIDSRHDEQRGRKEEIKMEEYNNGRAPCDNPNFILDYQHHRGKYPHRHLPTPSTISSSTDLELLPRSSAFYQDALQGDIHQGAIAQVMSIAFIT